MTAIIASGDLSDGAKLNPAVKALHEQLLSIVKELPGGATKGTTRTISSGTIQIQNDVCIYPVDVEGGIASSDDLDFLTAATPADLRDGLIVGLAPLDANRNINVKHNTTGTGKFITRSGRDVLLRATNEFFWARYDASASAWYQINPDISAELDRLVGARPVSTLTVSSSAITPDRAIHKITAGAPANLDLIAQTNYLIDQASVLIITTAAASSAITVRHNQTGTGKILLRDSTDFVLPVGATLALYKDGTTWVELWRELGSLPAGAAAGDMAVYDGGKWVKLAAPATDGFNLVCDTAQALKMKWAAAASSGALTPGTNGFRLSLSSTDPEPSSDITGASTLYMLPYKHDIIELFDGTSTWLKKSATSKSIAIPADPFRLFAGYAYSTGSGETDWDLELDPWDVSRVSSTITAATVANPCVITLTSATGFSVGDKIGIVGGTATGTGWTDTKMGLDGKEFYVSAVAGNNLTLEGCISTGLAFTTYGNATAYRIPATPATDITRQNGVWSKSGTLTRRYLGVIKTNKTGVCNYAPAAADVGLGNADNQIRVKIRTLISESSYTWSSNGALEARNRSLEISTLRSLFVLALPQVVLVSDRETTGEVVTHIGVQFDRIQGATVSAWTSTDNAEMILSYDAFNFTSRKLAKGAHFAQKTASYANGYSGTVFGSSNTYGIYSPANTGMDLLIEV